MSLRFMTHEIKEKNKVISVKLTCENVHMTTHIEYKFKGKLIKKGMLISLKDDERIWTIDEVYGDPIDKTTLKRGWNNNI